ncbi:hypothetical protein L7F22_058213 [Adiantum nelumboides]|nr:hypothetical protein [Adiantum nelumboides]
MFAGKPFLFWLGWNARLTLVDPELCKEVLSNKFGQYSKPSLPIQRQDLFAKGLVTLDGEKWAQHRRIVNPAFFSDKLKVKSRNLASVMLEKWKSESENSTNKEIDVCKEFQALTADIISHTAFGSSYAEGKQVFLLQYEQQVLFLKLADSVLIPGAWFSKEESWKTYFSDSSDYRLKLPESWKIQNAFHVILLKPSVGDMPAEEQLEAKEFDEILVPKHELAHKERK